MNENKNENELRPSWNKIVALTEKLAHLIPTKYMAIVAVSRGGLVPAGLLSHLLNVKVIDTICPTQQPTVKVVKGIKSSLQRVALADKILIIDDVADTGNTINIIRKHLPRATYATLYAKPQGLASVDAYAELVFQGTWIHFPWELGDIT